MEAGRAKHAVQVGRHQHSRGETDTETEVSTSTTACHLDLVCVPQPQPHTSAAQTSHQPTWPLVLATPIHRHTHGCSTHLEQQQPSLKGQQQGWWCWCVGCCQGGRQAS
jgi:hypothetical protein